MNKISTSGFTDWTPATLPDLTGKTFVMTGANSGLGFEASKQLLAKGGHLVMVCRDRKKAMKARNDLVANAPGQVDIVICDLADLSSIRTAAAEVRGLVSKIDALINNAGIMMTPQSKTKDGFELQFGSNHLGHFLWTGLLIDLVKADSGRVVTVASGLHKPGKIHFDDLMLETGYTPGKAYSQSKLANLMFAITLDRRLKAAGSTASSIACHPGYAATNLQLTGPVGFARTLMKYIANPLIAQKADRGAQPITLAAAGAEAQAGGYYGPQKGGEMRGPISDALVADQALIIEDQDRLWALSEELVKHEWSLRKAA